MARSSLGRKGQSAAPKTRREKAMRDRLPSIELSTGSSSLSSINSIDYNSYSDTQLNHNHSPTYSRGRSRSRRNDLSIDVADGDDDDSGIDEDNDERTLQRYRSQRSTQGKLLNISPRLAIHQQQRNSNRSNTSNHTPKQPRSTNRILLHIYDLISSDTLMQLPWGCVCEIGKCFNDLNSAMHELGTGAYHVGVEVNGLEYAYGACRQVGKSGVFSCIPRASPGYQYRTSIDFGTVVLRRTAWQTVDSSSSSDSNIKSHKKKMSPQSVTSSASLRHVEHFVDGRIVMKEMAAEYMGSDYDILRKNCCTFAHDACVRLGVGENLIPSWFRNLAETGAYSQDFAASFVEPLQKVLSHQADEGYTVCGDGDTVVGEGMLMKKVEADDEERGFEVVAKRNAADTRDVVVVIDADVPNPRRRRSYRRAASAY